MPVFSSGQSAAQAVDTFKAIGTTDLIFAAGGGIMGHPDGIAAGVGEPPAGLGGGRGRLDPRGLRRALRRAQVGACGLRP
jgi:hypothetical protein